MTQIVHSIDAEQLKKDGWQEEKIMVQETVYRKGQHQIKKICFGYLLDGKTEVQFMEEIIEQIKNKK